MIPLKVRKVLHAKADEEYTEAHPGRRPRLIYKLVCGHVVRDDWALPPKTEIECPDC